MRRGSSSSAAGRATGRTFENRRKGRPVSKIDLFFRYIYEEDTRNLREILQADNFSAIKPFNDQGIPPLHFAVLNRRLKSLKCLVEHIDRVHSQSDIDFRDDEHDQTPLMLAAELGWVEGAKVLLENGADLTVKDEDGHTAREYGVLADAKQVLSLFDEWKTKHNIPEEVLEEEEVVFETSTQKNRSKRKELERQQLSTMELAVTGSSNSNTQEKSALEKKKAGSDILSDIDERTKLSSLADWDELKLAIHELRRDLNIDRSDNQVEGSFLIDPALWSYDILQRLSLRIPNGCMSSLPEDLGKLSNLSSLIINDNSFRFLPESIGQLHALRVLEVENNQLEQLPESIGQCKKLEAVRLSGNKLKSLKPLNEATDLVSLHCDRNQLEELDLDFTRMNRLAVLSATGNRLKQLPDSIGCLDNLTTLQLSRNEIQVLPNSMGDLKKLQTVTLDENPIRDKKILKILTKGKKPMKEFLQYVKKQRGRKTNNNNNNNRSESDDDENL
ncbi:hypothetical protein GAYE_SCF65G6801 [Galdieria yellowstonensis]|uniref:Disease resistance R13L4/SHOC-2-like LRR domain-containing protein n=1 Tax=Galdieria yellowstonensis TaxID=3028027 RepID=A0AAV9INN8_9RHOD|nr:hypothetical protein GAYE_SCF65G6801 [Galdieria yellowstonensis]